VNEGYTFSKRWAGAKGTYVYDFGDGWQIRLTVEKVLLPEPGVAYPVCTDGKRRGPLEDCGGVPEYYNLLEVLSDPGHEDYEMLTEWAGANYDPERFNIEAVNGRLLRLQRGWAKA
jgi:hypothetical protein